MNGPQHWNKMQNSSCRVLMEDLFDRIPRLIFVEKIHHSLEFIEFHPHFLSWWANFVPRLLTLINGQTTRKLN